MLLNHHLDKKPLQFALVLAFVAGRPGISFQDILALSDVSKASLSRIMAWHEEAGLVITRPMPDDRSSKVAYLTPKGEKFVNEVWAVLD